MRRRPTDDQPTLFGEDYSPHNKSASTFSDSLSLPIHRWFRYSAGFSALWVRQLILRARAEGRSKVLDPFAGSGTVGLESEFTDTRSIGIEAHPFVARIAATKLKWRQNPAEFHEFSLDVLRRARRLRVPKREFPMLLQKCYPLECLERLESLRLALNHEDAGSSSYSPLAWLALVSILRECSPVGTAQWQYVLPRKSKARVLDPYEAFTNTAAMFRRDMEWRHRRTHGQEAAIYQEDARLCASVPDNWADLVITSPPYANNYDYADATRLEIVLLQSNLEERSGRVSLTPTEVRHEQTASAFFRAR